MCLTYLALQRGFMDNIRQVIHCRAFTLMSNKLHMDVHQWVERTLLILYLLCLTFLKAVPAYEATKVK